MAIFNMVGGGSASDYKLQVIEYNNTSNAQIQFTVETSLKEVVCLYGFAEDKTVTNTYAHSVAAVTESNYFGNSYIRATSKDTDRDAVASQHGIAAYIDSVGKLTIVFNYDGTSYHQGNWTIIVVGK
jgi:hypothetical protein